MVLESARTARSWKLEVVEAAINSLRASKVAPSSDFKGAEAVQNTP